MRIILFWLIGTFVPLAFSAQIQFSDVTSISGIDYAGKTFGMSWGDVNGDGYPDLFSQCHANAGESFMTNDIPKLYLNLQGQGFEDILDLGSGVMENDWHGGVFFDIDKDGDQDFLNLTGGNSGNILFLNNDGLVIQNHASPMGIHYAMNRGRTPGIIDLDQDGYTDVIINSLANPDASYPPAHFKNEGGQSFSNISDQAGIDLERSIFSVVADLEHQGDMEVIFLQNRPKIYSIQDGAFEYMDQMNTSLSNDFELADLDNDGLLDMYIGRGALIPEAIQLNDTMMRAFIMMDEGSGSHGISFKTDGDFLLTISPREHDAQFILHLGESQIQLIDGPWEFMMNEDTPSNLGIPLPTDTATTDHAYAHYDPEEERWFIYAETGSPETSTISLEIISENPLEQVSTFGFPEAPSTSDVIFMNQGGYGFQALNGQVFHSEEIAQSVVTGDFDNDMDIDLYVVNSGSAMNRPNILYENDGQNGFIRHEDAGGADGGLQGIGECVTSADFDNDGFLDLCIGNGTGVYYLEDAAIRLYRNEGNTNHWVGLELHGVESDPMGLHSWVAVYTNDAVQYRYQDGGVHRYSQNDSRLLFGLGTNNSVDSIVIDWASGTHQVLTEVPIDQYLDITETQITDIMEYQLEEWRVFPNPSNGRISVQGIQSTDHLSVYDALGRPVDVEWELIGGAATTEGLPKGVFQIIWNTGKSPVKSSSAIIY